MDKQHKEVIQVTKEIVTKFIETQRISPTNFPELFPAIYKVVQETIVRQDQSEDKKTQE